MSQEPFLPYGRQCIDDDDIAAVTDVLRGDWLTTGPAVADFELALAGKLGVKNAMACANGTAALHLAALALELGPGDSVVVPAVTFLATANAARFVGAEVVFADVDPETGLMRPEDLVSALDRPEAATAKAIFPVHLAGQCCDMPAIADVARERGLAIVEDSCHAIGTSYRTPEGGRGMIGDCRYSDMATFSFHAVKSIAMGEGGAVTANNRALADRVRLLRNHGMVRDPDLLVNTDLALGTDGAANPWYYEMPEPGFNYRASDIHCALGLSQLKKLDRFAAVRRRLSQQYDEALAPLSPRIRPLGRVTGCDPAWHLYVVLADFDQERDRAAVMNRLRDAGIGSQVHYMPLHLQPYYRRRYGDLNLPGAKAYYRCALSLPLHVGMTPADVALVVNALEAAFDFQSAPA